MFSRIFRRGTDAQERNEGTPAVKRIQDSTTEA